MQTKYTLTASEIFRQGPGARRIVGGKAYSLAELTSAGFNTPEWFAMTPASASPDLQVNPSAKTAILSAVQNLASHARRSCQSSSNKTRYAVRSSASCEDGAVTSMAGQLATCLGVLEEDILGAISQVWKSSQQQSVMNYMERQAGHADVPVPAVIVQVMLEPDSAGVAFSADPLTGERDVVLVEGVHGQGHGLVNGELDADSFKVRNGSILGFQIAEKTTAYRQKTDGSGIEQVPAPRQAVLSTDQVKEIAGLAKQAERHFGCPQDIEWAIERGQLYILQSRPITTLSTSEPRLIFDNSNISESYNGVTTPLTFTFALKAYEHVYRNFCRLMSVPETTIQQNSHIFPRMLGLIQGRIYYNLLNWYTLLSLLPGYGINRRFMEQMMGVKESLDWQPSVKPASSLVEKASQWIGVAGMLAGLVAQYCLLERNIDRFYQRLRTALSPVPLHSMSPQELIRHYRSLESTLLSRWDAPLVNDFFAMIFYGLLKVTCQKWLGDKDGTLQNELLCCDGAIISAEPARAIRAMAVVAAEHNDIAEALRTAELHRALEAVQKLPKLKRMYREYVDQFGDRCIEELKLETPTLADNPLPLLRSIGAMAARVRSNSDAGTPAYRALDQKLQTEQLAKSKLISNPVKLLIFNFILANARRLMRNRENLRFERTRVFGHVRKVFLQLGRRYAAAGILKTERDIFYLELEEALALTERVSTLNDVQALISLRKAEFEAFRRAPEPPSRLVVDGATAARHQSQTTTAESVSIRSTFEATAAAVPSDLQLRGTGCSPGVVTGRVRVVLDPSTATIEEGEIIVAKRTDPGWIMLFPSANGLLVEQGSLLSHSAIVSRELGLPAIVGISNVTTLLRTGDYVEFDGKTGIVTKLVSAATSAA